MPASVHSAAARADAASATMRHNRCHANDLDTDHRWGASPGANETGDRGDGDGVSAVPDAATDDDANDDDNADDDHADDGRADGDASHCADRTDTQDAHAPGTAPGDHG